MNVMLIRDILTYLGCQPHAPTLRYLNRLIHAYIRRVPWESVSRIVKRRGTLETKECPRLPEEFWSDAIQRGFGGTCYESSLAFYSLLTGLGYAGYLTVNDMGYSRGCHAAITLLLDGQKYLVDITIPIHAAVRINPRRVTRRETPFYNYAIRPVQANVYAVTRSHHPKKNVFTLIDLPVSLPEYRAILENDYLETGHFNKSVVVNKVVGCKTTRFFSDNKPYRLERFDRAGKQETLLQVETLPRVLAETFDMPEGEIAAAFSLVQEMDP